MIKSTANKLNQLMTLSPKGGILTTEWLNTQGIDYKLAWWYVQSGWLTRICNKVYKINHTEISWAGAIAALQQQLMLPIHIGGKSALQLLGKAHYLPLADQIRIELFAPSATALPNWLTKAGIWDAEFHTYKTHLFNDLETKNTGLVFQEINGVEVWLAAPERAILEVLLHTTKTISYEEALQLMENLPYLRPKLVQTLLESCSSIKTKRLFLFAAELCQHEWINELNIENLQLGSAKITIGKGGSYYAKYKLAVPNLKDTL